MWVKVEKKFEKNYLSNSKFHVDNKSLKELKKIEETWNKLFTVPMHRTSSGLQAVGMGQVFGQVKLPSLSGTVKIILG
jgi:hypothetical protein